MPTGGQASRWQAIADATTIGSSLVDLKEKGATPQYRRFLYVDCIKRTTAALGCRVRNTRTRPPPAEPPRNVLRGTSRTGGECRFEEEDAARYHQEKKEATRLGKLQSHTEA